MIAWLALGFALVQLAFLAGVVFLAARFWRQVRPQVLGAAAMFGLGPREEDDGGA